MVTWLIKVFLSKFSLPFNDGSLTNIHLKKNCLRWWYKHQTKLNIVWQLQRSKTIKYQNRVLSTQESIRFMVAMIQAVPGAMSHHFLEIADCEFMTIRIQGNVVLIVNISLQVKFRYLSGDISNSELCKQPLFLVIQ